MRNYSSISTVSLLVTLMMPVACYSATPIEIGETSNVFDGTSCEYYLSNTKKPKLIKISSDDGTYGHFEYEHSSGRANLVIGSDNKQVRVAVMNINGKEVTLKLVKQKPVQCLDEVHNKQTDCSMDVYVGHDTKLVVKRMTSQSACYPDSSSCAGDGASVLVTINESQSLLSVVMVGGCGE